MMDEAANSAIDRRRQGLEKRRQALAEVSRTIAEAEALLGSQVPAAAVAATGGEARGGACGEAAGRGASVSVRCVMRPL